MSIARIDELDQCLTHFRDWGFTAALIEQRIEELKEKLVTQNDEQTRGAIKELRNLIDLPATLKSERDYLAAALSDSSDAA